MSMIAEKLKKKQRELLLSNAEFAKYLGVHISWLNNKYSENEREYPLREKTMQKLHELIGLSYEDMEAYNKEIVECRKKR